MQQERWLSVDEIAAHMGVNSDTVYKWIERRRYRKYVKVEGENRFTIDEMKIEAKARYDGTWVLRTNLDLPAEQVALKYKQLWMVEDLPRTMRSILETRLPFTKSRSHPVS
jgi:excisionase family DNA binding protein